MPYSQESVTEQSKHWIRKILPFLVGMLLAVLASGLLSMAQAQPRLDILAVGLSAIGSVYVGSAIAQQQQQDVWVETIIAVVCVVIALLGLWKSPLWLLVGYVLHGVWDLFHHAQSVGTQISQRWYPPLCVGFDWAIAVFIGLWYWPT